MVIFLISVPRSQGYCKSNHNVMHACFPLQCPRACCLSLDEKLLTKVPAAAVLSSLLPQKRTHSTIAQQSHLLCCYTKVIAAAVISNLHPQKRTHSTVAQQSHLLCCYTKVPAAAVISRVFQNHICTPYMAVCMVISLLKISYIHRIYVCMYGFWPSLVISSPFPQKDPQHSCLAISPPLLLHKGACSSCPK